MKLYLIKDGYAIDIVELPAGLNENFQQGETWEDVEKGDTWVQLSEEQGAFCAEHPTASAKEVWDMKIDVPEEPEPPITDKLQLAKQAKLQAIREQDRLSDKFFISFIKDGKEVQQISMWLSLAERASLLTNVLPALKYDGQTAVTLWDKKVTPFVSITVPIAWAEEKLKLVEIYANATYNLAAANEAAVYAATMIEEVDAIDVAAGYPKYLMFDLNLDL